MSTPSNIEKRNRRHARIRAKVSGTAERPRLCVFKSNTTLEAQLINDDLGVTLASAKGKSGNEVGSAIAKAGAAKGVSQVVFDRGGFIYTGKVKALAEAARENGLKF
jgi:large subunit ribosomal protein L18